MRSIIPMAALLAVAFVPAAEAAHQPSRAAAVPAAPDPEAVRGAADFEAYLAWLVEVERRNAPGNEAIGALRGAWEAALASGQGMRAAAALRPAHARAVAALDSAYADLGTIAAPNVSRLDLPPDLQPPAMIALLRQSNRELRTVALEFLSTIDAMEQGDRRAAGAALGRLMSTVRIVLASQAAVMRARLAATPRVESAWEATELRLLLLSASLRIAETFPAVMASRPDPGLAPDLLRLADRLDANAVAGAAKIEAELASETAALRDAEASGSAADASVIRRLVAGLTVNRRVFAPSRALAATFRAQAPRLRGTLDLTSFRSLNREIRNAAAAIDQLADEQLQAMAAN
jgi:hypothetical protein